MKRFHRLTRASAMGALLLLSFGPGRAQSPGARPGTLLELQPVTFNKVADWKQALQRLEVQDLGAKYAEFQKFGAMLVFQQMIQYNLAKLVPSQGLKYASVDARNQPRVYSGRVFFPARERGAPPTRLPLVVYQHATETRRTFTPYYDKGDESLLGGLGAQLCGFAVAMPDGDGMGADPSPQPHAYCHDATTAHCLVDLIRAVLSPGPGKKVFDGINYVWDGNLFIMGYSEGGYIALAAVKEICTNPAYRDIKLTGAACMGGPMDLANTVRKLLGDRTTPYVRPYIPAYFLSSWQSIYPQDISLAQDINPKLLESQPARPGNIDKGTIAQWMRGDLGGDQITPMIQARLTGRKETMVPARSVANEAWVSANVDPPNSRLNQLLKQNTLVGGWAPRMPVLLVHDPFDECVGFDNATATFESWRQQGANPYPVVRLELRGRGPGHVGGALLSIPLAFAWFKAGMPRSPLGFDFDAIKTRAEQLKEQAKHHVNRLINALPSLPGRR